MAAVTIGLDVGRHAVRAVAVRRTGTRVEVAACAEVPRRDEAGEEKPLRLAVGELDSKLRLAGRVVAGVSDITCLVRYVSTVPLPPARLQRLLRLEVGQHLEGEGELAADAVTLPVPGDELVHCCILGQALEVHAALAELKAAGVVPAAVGFAPAALFNTTLAQAPEQGESLALLVDVGAGSTGVALVGEERFLACRQIPVGGDAFTDALVAISGGQLTRPKAEQAKIRNDVQRPVLPAKAAAGGEPGTGSGEAPALPAFDLDLGLDEPVAPSTSPAAAVAPAPIPAVAPVADDLFVDGDEAPVGPGTATMAIGRSALGPELTRVAEALYVQLAGSVSWFRAQLHRPELAPRRVLLCGAGSELEGLDQYLARRFNLPVERFDPFAGLTGALPEQRHRYAAALGLALCDRPGAVSYDLRPDTVLRREAWRRQVAWPFVAAGLIAAAGALATWTIVREQQDHQATVASVREYERKHEALTQELAKLDAERDAAGDDLRAIANRIYTGRDVLYALRAIKEQAVESKELWLTRFETVAVGGAEAKPVPGPRGKGMILGGGGPDLRKTQHRDTLLDRGAIAIDGRVKFESAPTAKDRLAFFQTYKDRISQWRPAKDQPELFRRLEVTAKENIPDPQGKEEQLKFSMLVEFQPTKLDQLVVEEAAKPAPKPPGKP